MAARALPLDACDQIVGDDDSLSYLATHSQTYTPTRSLAYTATRSMPYAQHTAGGAARRALVEPADEVTIDVFATPERCGAKRAMDPATAARNAVLVAAIAGPVAAAAQAMRAELPADPEAEIPTESLDTTAILTVGSTPAPESNAFVARKVRRRKGAMGVVGLAAAVAFTGVGMSVQAVSANDSVPSTTGLFAANADADQAVSVRVDSVSRDTERPELSNEFAAGEPLMSLTAKPAIEGVTAPGQLAPNTPAQAIETAKSMVGDQNYGNMCLALVSAFYGYSSAGIASAQDAAGVISAAGMMHTDMEDIPVGALIWYDGLPSGNPYGHVAMYAGDGQIYSNGASTGVGTMSINTPADDWHEPIIGWSAVWLPGATK